MSENHSLAILGRQPELGLAELESLLGAGKITPLGKIAASLDAEQSAIDFERLGGTVKLAKILSHLPHDWPSIEQFLAEQIPVRLEETGEGKFHLGLSVYGMDIQAQTINRSLLKLKRIVKNQTGRSIRVVPNKTAALSSAQTIHNKLIGAQGWELIVVGNGPQAVLGLVSKVQDIAAYGRRDQARPRRDAKVGMLPPKLAQIIINLATARSSQLTILDPFCGTGVILQEAMLMGYPTVGTDIDERMVEYTRANIDWLRAWRPDVGSDTQVELGDATKHTWPADIDAVASETYLGRPLAQLPNPGKLHEIVQDVNTILTKFLKNLAPQLKSGTRLCLAIPAWRSGTNFISLPLVDFLSDMGYNLTEFQHAPTKLIYWRPGQIVGRQLLVLEKL